MANAFTLDEGADKIATLTFDVPGAKVNTFATEILKELGGIAAKLESRTDLRGLLVRSGKPGQFIAGADLNELAALAYVTKEQAEKGIGAGHGVFDRFSKLQFPTVALIDGATMGGGTEFALSLDERICSTNPKTQIGLPETKIGLFPGWGGTQRLPRLIGVPNAIEMICSGEPVNPQKAVALGLVFDAVPAERLLDEGRRLLEHLIASGAWRESRKRRSQPVGLSQDEMMFAFAGAEGLIRAKTKGHYPAPLIALKAIKEGCNLPLEEGLKAERKIALEVMGSPISANLIAVFFMNNRLERDRGVSDPNIAPRDVKRAGVLGSGLMGSGIVGALLRGKLPTAMVDVDDKQISQGQARIREAFEGRIKIGRSKPADLIEALGRLSTSTAFSVFSDADFVIEAITENEQLKTESYRKLAGLLPPNAILASNTSTISITRLAEATPFPDRFVGMHFFNPVERMPLVEVIRGAKTSDETVATTVALAKRIRKTPLVVRDCPGFLVNRILFPYLTESIVLLTEGADMDALDKAATKFGMPMGPIALHDVVGLDTSWYAGNVILKAFTDRAVPMPLLGDLVQAGRLGQKSGAGFRKFGGKNPKGAPDPALKPILEKNRTANRTIGEQEMIDRLFIPMLFEATRCLEEQIVREPADVDMGLILGIGFPAFRGGLLRWCDAEGAANLLKRAEAYAHLGKRFEPTETMRRHASTGEKFYPPPKNVASFGG